MITIGRDLATGQVVIRNYETETVLKLDPDPESFEMFAEMIVEELGSITGSAWSLEEYDL